MPLPAGQLKVKDPARTDPTTTCPLPLVGPLTASLSKPERVQVRVLEDEPDSHRLAGQSAHVGAALPSGDALDLVAEYLGAVSQCVTRQSAPFRVLNLDAGGPDGRRGRVAPLVCGAL